MNQNNRLRLYPPASSAKIQEKKYRTKSYLHFDRKLSFQSIKDKIKNPCWITKHGFYPFIHFQIKFSKYIKKERKKKIKKREIYYSSHIDSYIYKYYGDILNHKYNDTADRIGVSEVSTAYRNNLVGKSNIDFAKDVIDFIKKQNRAYIYVADFTSFFDSLDHKYLKDRIKSVLEVDTLPDDHYAVFKNITKFSWIEKEEIDNALNLKYKDERPNLSRYFDEKEFRDFKKENVQKNNKTFGIPQGAGISSVYSNIYLLEFDRLLNEYVQENQGIYRRYCDDLIIVIPIDKSKEFCHKTHIDFIRKVKDKIPNLEIQEEKTGQYFYTNNKILDLHMELAKLDYLGFSFDGHNVEIRGKSLFKYYSRAYKKVRISNRLSERYNQKAQRRSLYQNYTHLGKNKKGHGNFLSYVSRSQNIFDVDSQTNNLMENQVKNHWNKINARLEK